MASTEEKQTKPPKSIGYYFRIDFETIQGRLTAGFLSMALISFILIQAASYQWRRQLDNRNTLLYRIYPIELYTFRLLDELSEAQNTFEKALFFNNPDYIYAFEQHWTDKVMPSWQQLQKQIQQLNEQNMQVLVGALHAQLINLKREHDEVKLIFLRKDELQGITNIQVYLQNYLQANIAPLYDELGETAEQVLLRKQQLEREYEDTYAAIARWRSWIVAVEFLLAVAVAAVIGSLLIISILRQIRRLRDQLLVLSKGNLPPTLSETKDELNTLIRALNQVVVGLSKIKTFAQEVGAGRFDSEISLFEGEGELGRSLEEMKQQLKRVYETENKRSWASEGVAMFSRILREHQDDLASLARQVVGRLSRYAELEQVALFLLEEGPDGRVQLQLRAAFAYNKQKIMQKSIEPGEGLLGQVFLDGKTLHLKGIPEGYIRVVTGMGAADPSELLLVPLVYNEQVYGVLEAASLHAIEPYKVKFIEELSTILASTVSAVKNNERTRLLLSESQHKVEEVLEKEQQLRLQIEQLHANQQESENRLNRMRRELRQMQLIIDAISDVVVVYDDRGGIRMVNRAVEDLLGYLQGDLLSSSIRTLVNIPLDELKEVEFIAGHQGERIAVARMRTLRAVRKDGIEIEVQMAYQAVDMERERLFVATIRPL